MKPTKIKHGWQWRVYMYPKYVIKTKRPRKDVHDAVIKWLHMEDKTERQVQKAVDGVYSSLDCALKEIKNSRIPAKLLADIEYRKDGSIKQRRAVTLEVRFRNLIKKKDKKSMRNLIDQFVVLNLELWKYGLFEHIFNYRKNNGVIYNRVVFLDPFEMLYGKSEIENRLKEKHWRFFIKKDPFPADIQRYFIAQCDKHFTIKNFRKLWNTKRHHE